MQKGSLKFFMTHRTSSIVFTEAHMDKVFETLTTVDEELKKHFQNYLLEKDKNDLSERLAYFDIFEIARFIVDKIKSGQTDFLPIIFKQVEAILACCDTYIENLIVVGLFEGIQNLGGFQIDYYKGFDKWLQPLSKQKWDNLIDSWEGQEWRNKGDSPKIS